MFLLSEPNGAARVTHGDRGMVKFTGSGDREPRPGEVRDPEHLDQMWVRCVRECVDDTMGARVWAGAWRNAGGVLCDAAGELHGTVGCTYSRLG